MATDVPEYLRSIASGPEEEAPLALVELAGRLERDGTLYPAAAAAVPFLVGIACDAALDAGRRVLTLHVLARLAGARAGDPDAARAVLAALTADRDALGALLGAGGAPAAAVAGLAGRFAGPPQRWVGPLRALRDEAADPVVCANFAVALALSEGRPPERRVIQAAADLEWQVQDWVDREASGLIGLRISPTSAARLGAILARLATQRLAT